MGLGCVCDNKEFKTRKKKKSCFSCGVTNQIPPKTRALGSLLQIFYRLKKISPALEMLLLDYSNFFFFLTEGYLG